ncbi:YbjN domain-containing protein [Sphingomonas sp. SAFR-052]|uniref:YbjN domain-containing protein n=1 Tax=Sphingomonas sp. SAFR-052 TaxID=3436867 RepID=UPI003F8038D7
MIGALLWAAAALAAPDDAMLDLRQPGNVVTALQRAGYKGELKLNKGGEPYIQSNANGEPFTIEFYECDGLKDCKSFQFNAWYKKELVFSPEITNEWNAKKRFLKVAVDSDGDMLQFMDATVVGGMSQAQFAELLDWYQAMDGAFTKFLQEKRDAAKAKPAKQ